MFDVGFWELVILFGLGLVILGPERLPKVAMQVGNWAGQARRMARQLTNQIRTEINDIELEDPAAPPSPAPEQHDYHRPGMDDLDPATHGAEQTAAPAPDAKDTAETR